MAHPVGQTKARFFRGLGFDDDTLDLFEQALLVLAQTEDIHETEHTPHGTKYVVRGPLETPRGRRVVVDTVWIIEHRHQYPRFVTAYPV